MAPKILDALNLTFNKMHPKESKPKGAALSDMAAHASRSVNALFENAMVKEMRLVPFGDPDFKVSSSHPCLLIETKKKPSPQGKAGH